MSVEAPAPIPPRGLSWLDEFSFGRQGLVYRKTGARVALSRSLMQELGAWLTFYFAVEREAARLPKTFTIAFSPDRGRPWYLIWAAVKLAGGRIATRAGDADLVMHFEDATFSPNAPPTSRGRLINFDCSDVSKSRVAEAFEEAFGYPLAIDPARHSGPAVEKSELNGAHDGHIVTCPKQALPGRVYQRLVDNQRGDLVEDLRCPTIAGRPVVVFIKRRPVTKRFANANVEVELKAPEDVFSADELSRIAAFAHRLGLDWGGLDVLRDRQEGRLYIVDANKTDMGPPTALPLKEKLAATRMLASAFRAHFIEGAR
ncbi:MAG: hypothetical protein AB7J28_04500 [Hyphomonadaceae bacterium]